MITQAIRLNLRSVIKSPKLTALMKIATTRLLMLLLLMMMMMMMTTTMMVVAVVIMITITLAMARRTRLVSLSFLNLILPSLQTQLMEKRMRYACMKVG